MGRQIHFHMLGEDCSDFFAAVLRRDPCVVTIRDAPSPSIEPVEQPCQAVAALVLWNQQLGRSIERRYVSESAMGPHYRFPYEASALEFSPTERTPDWDGRPAMCAGRIYAARYQDDERLAKWFDRIAGWLRRRFHTHRIASSVTYVGEGAWRWHEERRAAAADGPSACHINLARLAWGVGSTDRIVGARRLTGRCT